MRKIIAFDIDNTLVESKSPLTDGAASVLARLLDKYEVAVISGSKFEVFLENVINRLEVPDELLGKLHIMPTCGTRYLRYDAKRHDWTTIYENNLTEEQKARVRDALERGAKQLGLWEDKPYGEIIEDRGSQITYSALGQDIAKELGDEGLKRKYSWDPDMKKRNELRDLILPELSDLEVRVGGITSIDVTLVGVDKAYGMKRLLEATGYKSADILFVGDMLQPGGNDYPVKEFGIDCIEVSSYRDTPYVIEGILGAGA